MEIQIEILRKYSLKVITSIKVFKLYIIGINLYCTFEKTNQRNIRVWRILVFPSYIELDLKYPVLIALFEKKICISGSFLLQNSCRASTM